MKKIAIIGAGAAGLMAAISAARAGADVTLFERNAEAGKKILASGNGRCNIINTQSGIDDFHGENPEFVRDALAAMPFQVFRDFCESIGLLLTEKSDGKCYPLSNEARSVQSAFVRAAKNEGVTFVYGRSIDGVTSAHEKFRIGETLFDRLILCAGSAAAPQLGGNTSGLDIARSFGHTVVEPFPSLVGLHLSHPALAAISGVKCDARLTLFLDKKKHCDEGGDVLFTRYGISGFAVLDTSHEASRACRDGHDVSVAIDLLPKLHTQSLAARIMKMAKTLGHTSLYDLMCGIVSHKLVRPLLKDAGVDPERACTALDAKTVRGIVHTLKQWRFDVTGTHGFKHAEVAGGGVNTYEIDAATMQSYLVPGLYFAGEMLDVTGKRGGFNFHFAWGSGFLAGKHAAG